jgi:multidrug transporter EmrE-like cation transporter
MIAGVALTMLGDVFLKRSDGWTSPGYLALGLLLYALGCLPVAFIFKKMQFGEVFVVWEALTVVLAMFVGHSVFGDPITRSKIAALALAVCAIALTFK